MTKNAEQKNFARIEHDVYVTLKDHFDALRAEQDKRIQQALDSSNLAIVKAEEAVQRRLDLLNEFRGQAADESKKYALKNTVERLDTQVARLYGGLAVVAIIGIANLVKLWLVY
jgi:hypothetical protein